MSEKPKRAFRGIWIPAEIWLNSELSLLEKCFFVEIDSLDNERGCFASNAYFSEFFGLSKQRCSQVISSLIKKNYLTVEYEYQGKEISCRTLKITGGGIKFSKGGIKKINKGYQENAKDNNTFNNTMEINEWNGASAHTLSQNTRILNELQAKELSQLDAITFESCHYFLEKYYSVTGQEHPAGKKETWKKAILVLDSHGVDQDYVDRYFEISFQYPVDRKIWHFASPGILENRAFELAREHNY